MASKPTRDYWKRVILKNFEDRAMPPQFDELNEVINQWQQAVLDVAVARGDRERLRQQNAQLLEACKMAENFISMLTDSEHEYLGTKDVLGELQAAIAAVEGGR